VKYPYGRWERTLRRLAIRYRKPYAARHTSVSWNLMLGRNPLLVAKEHGHRIITMLTVYAAWVDGATEADIAAIRAARTQRRSSARPSAAAPARTDGTTPKRLTAQVPVPPPEVPALTDRVRWSAQAWRRRLANGGAAVGAPEGTDLRDEDEFGGGFASSGPLLAANYMNRLRKTGGADGTRTRHKSSKISKLLNRKDPDSRFNPYDPQILHQISHYLRVPETGLYRPSQHCS
jgi:hypothetical protein